MRACESASCRQQAPETGSQRQKAGCARLAGKTQALAVWRHVSLWARSRACSQPTAGIKIEAPSGPANQAAGRDQGQGLSKRALQGPTSVQRQRSLPHHSSRLQGHLVRQSESRRFTGACHRPAAGHLQTTSSALPRAVAFGCTVVFCSQCSGVGFPCPTPHHSCHTTACRTTCHTTRALVCSRPPCGLSVLQ